MKRTALVAGLGSDRLPAHLAQPELDAGCITRPQPRQRDDFGGVTPISFHVAWRKDTALGPVSNALQEYLAGSA